MPSDADRSGLPTQRLPGAKRWTEELEAFSDAERQLTRARERLFNRNAAVSVRQASKRRPMLWALGLTPLLAAAAFLLVRARALPTPSFAVRASASGEAVAAQPGDEVASPPGQERIVSFWERSEVRLAPGAKARVIRLTPRGAQLELLAGEAEVRITPSADGTWEILVGRFRVAVLGTHFFVSRDAAEDGLTIRLVEGKVAVSSACLSAPERMSAGERRAFRCGLSAQPPTAGAAPVPSTPPIAATSDASDKPALNKPAIESDAPKTPSALRQEVALVQSIRTALATDPARALTLIQETRRRFPKGSLVEDREAFEVLALERLGRHAEAGALAESFLRRYPHSPFSARMKRLASKPPP